MGNEDLNHCFEAGRRFADAQGTQEVCVSLRQVLTRVQCRRSVLAMSGLVEPLKATLRPMRMEAWPRLTLTALACGALSACAGPTDGHTADGADCVSHYAYVASASTWTGLRHAMLRYSEWGAVAAVRTQAQGEDVGAGNQPAVRVVDLLDRSGQRLVQVDVWRTNTGAWRAGVWNQCID